jgi:hypothetical protein
VDEPVVSAGLIITGRDPSDATQLVAEYRQHLVANAVSRLRLELEGLLDSKPVPKVVDGFLFYRTYRTHSVGSREVFSKRRDCLVSG